MLYDTDSADLIEFARRWANLGDAVDDQVVQILDDPRGAAGLREDRADLEVNPNAIVLARERLGGLNEVHFVDVGQGDAIWIHTHDDNVDGNGRFEGFNIVIDGGPASADQSNRLLQYLRDQGHHGAVIDALIVTHPHTDHFRGAETITRHFEIRDYYDPAFPSTLSSYAGFLEAVRGTEDSPPRAETLHLGRDTFGTLDWGNELTAEFLYPSVANRCVDLRVQAACWS